MMPPDLLPTWEKVWTHNLPMNGRFITNDLPVLIAVVLYPMLPAPCRHRVHLLDIFQ